MEYNAQYFIDKFSAIPDNRWVVGYLGDSDEPDGEHCAFGHCGYRSHTTVWPQEATALDNIFRTLGSITGKYNPVVAVNDSPLCEGINGNTTPRERILIKLLEAQEHGL